MQPRVFCFSFFLFVSQPAEWPENKCLNLLGLKNEENIIHKTGVSLNMTADRRPLQSEFDLPSTLPQVLRCFGSKGKHLRFLHFDWIVFPGKVPFCDAAEYWVPIPVTTSCCFSGIAQPYHRRWHSTASFPQPWGWVIPVFNI